MNNTIHNSTFRKTVFGALALMALHFGCTQDQHVQDKPAGRPDTTDDGRDDGNGDGNQSGDDISVIAGGALPGAGDVPELPGGGEIIDPPGGSDLPGSGDLPGGLPGGEPSGGEPSGGEPSGGEPSGGEPPGGGGEPPGGSGEPPGGSGEPPGPVMCGETKVELIAGKSEDVGGVLISNDAKYIYVTFATEGGWLINTTHVQVGVNPIDGKPVPGQMEYGGEAAGATSYGVAISFASLGMAEGTCDTTLYVYAHANVYLPSGNIVILPQMESAWGGIVNDGGSDSWFAVATFTMGCCK